jgi:hypothetical protein
MYDTNGHHTQLNGMYLLGGEDKHEAVTRCNFCWEHHVSQYSSLIMMTVISTQTVQHVDIHSILIQWKWLSNQWSSFPYRQLNVNNFMFFLQHN